MSQAKRTLLQKNLQILAKSSPHDVEQLMDINFHWSVIGLTSNLEHKLSEESIRYIEDQVSQNYLKELYKSKFLKPCTTILTHHITHYPEYLSHSKFLIDIALRRDFDQAARENIINKFSKDISIAISWSESGLFTDFEKLLVHDTKDSTLAKALAYTAKHHSYTPNFESISYLKKLLDVENDRDLGVFAISKLLEKFISSDQYNAEKAEQNIKWLFEHAGKLPASLQNAILEANRVSKDNFIHTIVDIILDDNKLPMSLVLKLASSLMHFPEEFKLFIALRLVDYNVNLDIETLKYFTSSLVASSKAEQIWGVNLYHKIGKKLPAELKLFESLFKLLPESSKAQQSKILDILSNQNLTAKETARLEVQKQVAMWNSCLALDEKIHLSNKLLALINQDTALDLAVFFKKCLHTQNKADIEIAKAAFIKIEQYLKLSFTYDETKLLALHEPLKDADFTIISGAEESKLTASDLQQLQDLLSKTQLNSFDNLSFIELSSFSELLNLLTPEETKLLSPELLNNLDFTVISSAEDSKLIVSNLQLEDIKVLFSKIPWDFEGKLPFIQLSSFSEFLHLLNSIEKNKISQGAFIRALFNAFHVSSSDGFGSISLIYKNLTIDLADDLSAKLSKSDREALKTSLERIQTFELPDDFLLNLVKKTRANDVSYLITALEKIADYTVGPEKLDLYGRSAFDILESSPPKDWLFSINKLVAKNNFFVEKDVFKLLDEIKESNAGNANIIQLIDSNYFAENLNKINQIGLDCLGHKYKIEVIKAQAEDSKLLAEAICDEQVVGVEACKEGVYSNIHNDFSIDATHHGPSEIELYNESGGKIYLYKEGDKVCLRAALKKVCLDTADDTNGHIKKLEEIISSKKHLTKADIDLIYCKAAELEVAEELYGIGKDLSSWSLEDFVKWRKGIGPANDDNIAEIIAVLNKAVHKSQGYYLLKVQLISILSLFKFGSGCLAQIATGEGKSSLYQRLCKLQ